jgi:glycosyltransferase involved in cell wall biosynthesis
VRLVIDLQACQSRGSLIRGSGRYSLALARAMVEKCGSHECVVALNGSMTDSVESCRAAMGDLLPPERIRSWAGVRLTGEANPEGALRSPVAGELFRQAMRELRPDFVHIGSLFEGWDNDVVSTVGTREQGLPTAVTLYDSILPVHADARPAEPAMSAWYLRRLEQLKHAELLLTTSAFARDEGQSRLGIDAGRIVNIRGGCDARFRVLDLSDEARLKLRQRHGIDRPYVMYAGGFGPHKKPLHVMRAFAALPADIRQAHQLLIAGTPSKQELAQIEALRRELGLAENHCVLCGYVSDEDMVAMYNDCRLYVLPAAYEGFGLPALEAMACGAVVMASNLGSLAEVINFADALFNPHDLSGMVVALQRGLCDEGFRQAFVAHARGQVRDFSWPQSARRAWEGMEAAHERRRTRQRTSVDVQYVSTSREAGELAGTWPGFIDRGEATTGQLASEDQPAYLVIADAASALIGLQVMRRRTVGVVLAQELSLSQVVRTLYLQPEGKRILDFILADQGAYAVASQTGEAFFAGLARAVEAWMERVSAQVMRAGDVTQIGITELAMHRSGRGWRAREAVTRILALPKKTRAKDAFWKEVAEAINHNRQIDGGYANRLLIDITQLVEHDARTGVQRVVRNLLRYFLRTPPHDALVLPVYFDYRDGSCHYASRFCWNFLGVPSAAATADDEIVDWLPGDRLIGLDLSAHIIPRYQERFACLRDLGVRIDIVLYDMLVEALPHYFDPDTVNAMRRWYRSVSRLADGVICISRAVADDFVNWLNQAKVERPQPIKVGHFQLGADPEAGHSGELNDADRAKLAELSMHPTVLMVSTIEPRKGYQQALDAFELLWQRGNLVNLAIVGKAGWHTEAFIKRLRNHPQAGRRLHWFEGASDVLLHALYKQCGLLLSASEGEGFGLPLIEAAQYGIPLLLRDLRVFREVAGEHAKYFDGNGPEGLARPVQDWLEGQRQGESWPDASAVNWVTWEQSYRQFLEALEGKRWDYEVGFKPC